MSSQNDLIKLNEVIAECTRLLKEQATGWQSIVKEIKNVNQSAPSQYIKMQREASKAIIDLEKAEQQYTKTLQQKEILEQKYLATQRAIIQTSEASRKASENYTKSIERQAQAEAKAEIQLAKSANTYTMIEQRVKVLTQTYNDLASKQALGMKLNQEEINQLAKMQGQLLGYSNILKTVDAQIGKNQRNVGNYASGWNPLNNAVGQLTRELPNLGISFQTFAMSISNNIGAMQDAITSLRAENKQLIADNKPTKSIIGQVAGAFLSLNTLLYIGVGLFTAYGKEIGVFISQMFKAEKAINAVEEATKQYASAVKDGVKSAQQEIIELKTYVSVAKDATASTSERMLAVNKLRDLYPAYFKDLTDEQILNSDLTNITNELTNALIKRAIYTASINKMTENAGKILDLEEELRLETAKLKVQREQVKVQADRTVQTLTTTTRDEAYQTGRLRNESDKYASTQQKILDLANQKKAVEEQNLFLQTKATALAEDALKHEAKTTKPEKSKNIKDTTEKDRLEALRIAYDLQVSELNLMEEGQEKELALLQAWYEYQNELDLKNKDKLLTNTNDYFAKLNNIIQDYNKKAEEEKKKADKLFLDEQDELFKEDEKNTKEYNDAVQKWKDEADERYLASQREKDEKFISQVKKTQEYLMQSTDLGNFGFSSLNIFAQLEENGKTAFENMLENAQDFKEKFAVITNAVGDILKDVLGQMEERQNAYFQQQFANLETEKDLAIKLAGENTAGREAIEKQYEEKKRALQTQQAKQQKQMAILQATINISQGITSALSQVPPYSFILAGLVGVLGAIQIAKIASAPLPQFWSGTDNAPEGLALTQERGAEMITDKNGKIKTLGNNKGAQLTYLNKGDKVFTADETTQKLNELLIGSGIAPIVNTNVNNGLSKEDLQDVMNKTLANQPKNIISYDELGVRILQEKQNKRTILKNRNVKI